MNFEKPAEESFEVFEGNNKKSPEEMEADRLINEEIEKAGGQAAWTKKQVGEIIKIRRVTDPDAVISLEEYYEHHIKNAFRKGVAQAKKAVEFFKQEYRNER